MKRLAPLSLAALFALAAVCRADDAPTSMEADAAAHAVEEMHGVYDMMGKELGGLSAEETAKVDALAKKLEADIKANPSQIKDRDSFELKVIVPYRDALTEAHAKQFDEWVARAKKMAEKSYNAASVSGICMGMNVYAADNGGKFPADLGELVLKGFCAPKQFVKKGSGTELPADLAKADVKEKAKWVNAHSDYVYLGAGMDPAKLDTDFVLIYDKDGTVYGCADGHVPVLKPDVAAKVLDELKAGKNPPPSLKEK